jgi:hypothetical protein
METIISFLCISRIPPQVWFLGFNKKNAHFFFFKRTKLASNELYLSWIDKDDFGFNEKWSPILGRACFCHEAFELF